MSNVIEAISVQTEKYKMGSDFLGSIFGESRESVLSGKRSIAIFGAGSAGRELFIQLEIHGCRPVCFSDNNKSLTGKFCCSVPVISVNDLKSKYEKCFIVIATASYRAEIREQLINSGFAHTQIFEINFTRAQYTLYLQFGPSYMEYINNHGGATLDLLSNKDKIVEAYSLLSDEKSKNLFIKRLAAIQANCTYTAFCDFLANFSEPFIRNQPQIGGQENHYYFDNDIIKLEPDEIFIDAGAYDGDTLSAFVSACNEKQIEYKQAICFEPDQENFKSLIDKSKKNKNVTCHPCGLSDQASKSNLILSGIGSSVSNDGEGVEIQLVSIDEFLPNSGATFIKMDIEGSEMDALRGAKNTISRYRPKLIISAYHRNTDIFDIILYLNEICAGYQFFLRHFCYVMWDTVLIAIPNKTTVIPQMRSTN